MIRTTYERIPALKQMMFGVDKSRYIPKSIEKTLQKQQLVKQIKECASKDYLFFTKDIRNYSFKKPIPLSVFEMLKELDLEEDLPIEFTCYQYIDVFPPQKTILYIVKYRNKKFLCFYRFKRYFNADAYPRTDLLYCIPIE